MKTKLTSLILKSHVGYGAGSGIIELFEYECPCGKGKISEEHHNIPGFEKHIVEIYCNECSHKYELNTSLDVRSWSLCKR